MTNPKRKTIMSNQRKNNQKNKGKIRSGKALGKAEGDQKHPFTQKKFKELPERANGIYGVDIEIVKDKRNSKALVIADEVIYYDEKITSIREFKKTLPRLKSKEKRIVKQCCWDKSLYIVESKSVYDTYDPNDKKQSKKSYNYLGYADGDDTSSTSESETTPVPPRGGGEQVKGEGTGIKIGRKDFRSILTCCQIMKMNEPVDKNKIQVGVVDFGWGDYHAETIKSIIEREYPVVQMHDYNLVASFKVASVLSICCQIARAINERMDILNMSIGYYSMRENQILKSYIEKAGRAGVLIVCSSGNSNNNNEENYHWPSNFSFDHNNVISVSAHKPYRQGIRKTKYSNYEVAKSLNVSAIGRYPYPDHIDLRDAQGRITHARGTSFSTAYVVACIARAFELNGKVSYLTSDGFDRNKILEDIM